jgi:hypothetical protein
VLPARACFFCNRSRPARSAAGVLTGEISIWRGLVGRSREIGRLLPDRLLEVARFLDQPGAATPGENQRAHARPADALRDWAMPSYAISSSMPAATAALLEHAMAGRAQAPHIGEQTSPHSLFIRYRISAQAEGIILASRLLLFWWVDCRASPGWLLEQPCLAGRAPNNGAPRTRYHTSLTACIHRITVTIDCGFGTGTCPVGHRGRAKSLRRCTSTIPTHFPRPGRTPTGRPQAAAESSLSATVSFSIQRRCG